MKKYFTIFAILLMIAFVFAQNGDSETPLTEEQLKQDPYNVVGTGMQGTQKGTVVTITQGTVSKIPTATNIKKANIQLAGKDFDSENIEGVTVSGSQIKGKAGPNGGTVGPHKIPHGASFTITKEGRVLIEGLPAGYDYSSNVGGLSLSARANQDGGSFEYDPSSNTIIMKGASGKVDGKDFTYTRTRSESEAIIKLGSDGGLVSIDEKGGFDGPALRRAGSLFLKDSHVLINGNGPFKFQKYNDENEYNRNKNINGQISYLNKPGDYGISSNTRGTFTLSMLDSNNQNTGLSLEADYFQDFRWNGQYRLFLDREGVSRQSTPKVKYGYSAGEHKGEFIMLINQDGKTTYLNVAGLLADKKKNFLAGKPFEVYFEDNKKYTLNPTATETPLYVESFFSRIFGSSYRESTNQNIELFATETPQEREARRAREAAARAEEAERQRQEAQQQAVTEQQTTQAPTGGGDSLSTVNVLNSINRHIRQNVPGQN